MNSPAVPTLEPSASPPKRRSRGLWQVILGGLCVAAVASIVAYYKFAAVPPDERLAVTVEIDGREQAINVEVFRPAVDHPGKHPALLFLHGVEGPERYRGPHTQSCRWLADQGYLVFYVHYFDAVDYEDLWVLRPDGSLDKTAIDAHCWEDAERWSSAVLQVVLHLSHRSDVDENRIALDGISLGGFIALEVADEAQSDATVPDIQAVVANWAAQFELTECRSGFSPTLHIHGELDEVVPLRDAQQSVDEILAVGSHAELLVVPEAPHVARSAKSDERTLSFLASYLKCETFQDTTTSFPTVDNPEALFWAELARGR